MQHCGYTGKRRGVYGDDIKNCDKYQPRTKKRRTNQICVGSDEWLAKNAGNRKED